MKYIAKDFPEFVRKPRQELYDHLKKEGYKLATIPDDLFTLPDEMKDGYLYFFFGSVFCDAYDYWGVPCVYWDNSVFCRSVQGLNNNWCDDECVVLYEDEKYPLNTSNGKTQKEINALINAEKKKVYQECIDLANKIETEAMHTEFNEWRAFKGFRNALRDKIKEL